MELKHRTRHLAKKAYIMGRNEFSTFVMSSVGVLIYAIGVQWFTLPYHFPDAGVMGIALLLKYTIGFSPALFIWCDASTDSRASSSIDIQREMKCASVSIAAD